MTSIGKLVLGGSFVAAMAISGQAFAVPISTVDTFTLSTYVGSGTAPAGPYGTITLTQVGSNVMVSEVLTNPPSQGFVDTGAGGSLEFDLFDGTATISPITVTGLTTGYKFVSLTAGSILADGSGTWNYEITCAGTGAGACGSGGSSPAPGPLSFTISNVTLADFIANPNGNFFASDLCLGLTPGTCTVTGDVVSKAGVLTAVPEPSSLAIFGAGLFGLWAFGRRKQPRKSA